MAKTVAPLAGVFESNGSLSQIVRHGPGGAIVSGPPLTQSAADARYIQVGAIESAPLTRVHNAWCVPGREGSGTAFRDISLYGNHATIEPGNTGAFGNDRYMSTTAASAGGLFVYPAGVECDLATDSVIFAFVMSAVDPVASETVAAFGAGTSGAAAPGFYFSHRVGGFGRVVFNNGAGVLVSGTDSAVKFSTAAGGREVHALMAWDAPTKSVYLYRDGALAVANNGLMIGANALVSSNVIYGPRLGGLGASIHTGSTASAVARVFRGWQGYILRGKGLPVNIGQIAAVLAENAGNPLTDNEFEFV